ncbi:MAG TPA: glycosyltransferase family 4 protein [Sedimentisphaerales bacterium]|nr:glycosyltransferase family 4 protein [Sedimentisphaerales bacterium]
MRILFITHYFQPEPNFFSGLPFAKELIRRGHEVQVLTGFPNYPGGRIYPGYKVRMLQRETLEGVPVMRVPVYPSHDRSSARRMLCYTSFGLSAATIGPWIVKDADVAYVSQGPVTVGLPACALRLLRRIPFVLHIQDLWPDTLESTGMFNSRTGMSLVHAACRFMYRRAGKIVVIAPGMKCRLIDRGVPEKKIELIYNWCDDALICRNPRDEKLAGDLGMTGRFNIVFAGNMGKAQALDPVLDAAAIVAQQAPEVQFIFIGSGVDTDDLKARSVKMGLNNVLFIPRRPISEIGSMLDLADVLLVHLRNDPLFRITIPSKIQAYMAAGRPILIAVPGDASDLVQKAGAGITCEPENAADIAAQVLKLAAMPRSELEQMGRRGAQYYNHELSFAVAVSRLEQVFSQAAT